MTSSDAEFRAMLVGSPEPVTRLAMHARDLIFEVLPPTVEVVWPHQRIAGFTISCTARGVCNTSLSRTARLARCLCPSISRDLRADLSYCATSPFAIWR